MMNPIKPFQTAFGSQLEKEAEAIGLTGPANLYQPIQYTLSMGGKRIRPVLVLMACDMFGGNIKTAMPAALGIEIFHNFTLLHDDIMDKASMRRNQPTVHKKYNENIAILSGDAMSNLAYRYMLGTDSPALKEVLSLFTETALQVCEGQQLDMDYEESLTVSIDDYLKMIRLKTAVLIAYSLKTGALLGNASPQDAGHLYEFGINLGLAFQLQDDLLDVYADQDKFGKKTGGDITSNKKTFLLLKSLELASPKQREVLLYWIRKEKFDANEKISSVKQIYNEINIQAISLDLIGYYYKKAMTELEAVDIETERKKGMTLLAGKMLKRKK